MLLGLTMDPAQPGCMPAGTFSHNKRLVFFCVLCCHVQVPARRLQPIVLKLVLIIGNAQLETVYWLEGLGPPKGTNAQLKSFAQQVLPISTQKWRIWF